MIVHDARNPVAVRNRALLEAHLGGDTIDGMVIVIGGDGFLLHTIAELGHERTYLGLNAGRVGFLLNDVDDWEGTANQLLGGAWKVTAFPLLEARCIDVDGNELIAHAVNDVYLERASGQTARLGLSVDGSRVVETLVADGVIVSTALGSTAYNFSAGGPACHPTLRILTVTPICPHLPRLSPFALPVQSRIDVTIQNHEHRPVRAVADGRNLAKVVKVSLGVAPSQLSLAHLHGHDFTSRMVEKILHP